MMNLVLPLLIGVVTGVITSLVGASGVALVVPVITMIFGLSVHTAIGVSLLTDVIASITVSWNYYKRGNIALREALWLIVGTLAGSQVGAIFASKMSEGGLGSSFGLITILFGLSMLLRKKKPQPADGGETKQSRIQQPWLQSLLILLVGIGIGLMSGLFGAGGGVMILGALIFFLRFPLHKAIGTSTFIMALTALSASASYAAHGNMDLRLALLLGLGSIVGGTGGAVLANRISEETLQKVAGLLFVGIGLFMYLSTRLG